MNDILLPITLNFENSKHLWWGQLHGASTALVIYYAAQSWQGPLLVITQDLSSAKRLKRELTFFSSSHDSFPILIFPDWETLPYDHFSPHQDIISARQLTLYQLPELKQGILLVSITSLMHRLAPRYFLEANSFILNRGDHVDPKQLRQRLEKNSYQCLSQVMQHGEFAVRGSIIDIYPMGAKHPYRIDLFDQEIDSIRTFDPDNQRTLRTIDKVHLLPAREFPLTDDAITRFRQAWRAEFSGNPTDCSIYENVSHGESAAGIEYYLPLFFDHTSTLFDYLPTNALVLHIDNITLSAETFWKEVNERYEQLRYDITHPLLEPNRLFLQTNQIFSISNQFHLINLQKEPWPEKSGHYNFPTAPLPNVAVDNKSQYPFSKIQDLLKTMRYRILICAESAGRCESLLESLSAVSLIPKQYANWQAFCTNHAPLGITIAPLEQSLLLKNAPAPIALISETQLFGEQVMQRRHRQQKTIDTESIIRDLTELSPGAPVVHVEHGIGRYLGLESIHTAGREAEYLMLEYAGGDKLYVPVAAFHLISRYTGLDMEHVSYHHLGSKQWQKAKHKAVEQIYDVAVELLDIYSRRAVKPRQTFNVNENYIKFASAFSFEETPDQKKSINDVISDMQKPNAMDRLVCGDVGFGKTEVAMRAAFIAAENGKQVAILTPTTLLTQQHYYNFCDRFADWPIEIEFLSRFRSVKHQQEIIQRLKSGKIDIIIGTHKLLQSSIQFKNLGLLIIDEEHRFGVQQKEYIKHLRTEVDILALTATPIPRTLNMAFLGVRDLSIITTPPTGRLSIKTFIYEWQDHLIRESILREILRGGQVYFLHNKIESINQIANKLQELIPEARIHVAHGQMREHKLTSIMSDFYHQRFNVLVCTTIIESGIDIPTANTIIMNRADLLGLAQMHQLRGRVGRSHHQAYAYLIIPPKNMMTKDAEKRLDAIASLEDLGIGFTLATHDLEIRGAGELLGKNQSGHIQAIGFSLYMELLEQAIKNLKAGKEINLDVPLRQGVEVDLHISALIPETYLDDVNMRLILYKRIASASHKNDLKELQVEMIDRFGLLPEVTKNLFKLTELKIKAQPLGIRKIDVTSIKGHVYFNPQPTINSEALIILIQREPDVYKLQGPACLSFLLAQESGIEERFQQVNKLLDLLAKKS